MAADHHFILDLTLVLGASALGGYVATRLRQPVLLGYLVSGFVVGPFGLQLLAETEQIKPLAEIGVAFLLFALGVEFSLAELKRVKEIAIQGSLLQIGLTLSLVAIASTVLGWVSGWTQGIFLGSILSLSSTAVVLKTLTERGEVNTLHGQVMLAILIAQDLALGLMLAILPALDSPEHVWPTLGAALLKVSIFLGLAIALGRWVVPPLIKSIARTESSELFLLTTIALCLSVALVTAHLGLSIEMGAFVAGLMMAEIDYADQALAKVLPLRDTFASLFFASIGMLIDPQILLDNFGIILGLVLMVMFGKALIIFPIVLKFGYSLKTAAIAALGLNQIGEFSFVLALEGFDLGLLTEEKYLLILGTTAITLILTPISIRFAPRLAQFMDKIPGLNQLLRQQEIKALSLPETITNHVVIAGYGRVGQALIRILHNQGHPLLVIDNSEAAIQRLRHQNIPYIFGDADSELVLGKAHLETAKALAITLPDPGTTRLLLKHALEFAPELDVVARSHNNSEIDVLTQLGAQEVVQPEFEAALEMGAHLLSTLGESQWAIQSVIQAIHRDHYRSVRPENLVGLQQKWLDDATESLHHEWVKLSETSSLDWMTLSETDIRHLTGVTVMAIQQGDDRVYYPKNKMTLRSGDQLLVVGKPEEILAFRDLVEGRSALAEGISHWLTLSELSPLIMLTPRDIWQKYQVVIQAVRRHGKLYNPVDSAMQLEADDCLLLRGESDRIQDAIADDILLNPNELN
ncbi:cation:proton antiporter [Roseofilum sp. Guam]|uniref:cation:proton antiporter domain-containing protein n=1 Tax=Roseofilum sp. Guam TaxID=2821502 RepID=UPI001B2DD731|nr:cation:proton antiporter [Roseofilum sp. Guam]MBP0029441.1 cation:proton antiporter [Roseofilum sp. Guam]